MATSTPRWLRARILLARHRRLLVATLTALAVAAGLLALRPPAAPTTAVPVAVRDLPTGHRLGPADVAMRAWPEKAAPAGLLARPQGRVLAAPVRSGEPVTDVRVTRAGSAGGAGGVPATGRAAEGRVEMTVRLADPAAAALLSAGDHIQVIAGTALDPVAGEARLPGPSPADAGEPVPARVIVDDAVVLAVPTRSDAGPAGDRGEDHGGGLLGSLGAGEAATREIDAGGASVLPAGALSLAVRPADALDLAGAAGVRALTVTRQLLGSS